MPARNVKRALRGAMMTSARLLHPLYRTRDGARIITYHSIGSRDDEMNVSPARFRDQMAWLRDHVSLVSLGEAIATGKGVAVTFDDGYRDNLFNAGPILAASRIPATVFVVAGRLGGTLRHTDSDGARLMTGDELRELQRLGVSVGAHGMTHRRLSGLALEDQHHEIAASKTVLEDVLGSAIEYFAYPYGTRFDYTDHTVAMVRQCSYRGACSNRFGPHTAGADAFTVRRINITVNDTVDVFRQKVMGQLDALALFESAVASTAKRAINRLLSQ